MGFASLKVCRGDALGCYGCCGCGSGGAGAGLSLLWNRIPVNRTVNATPAIITIAKVFTSSLTIVCVTTLSLLSSSEMVPNPESIKSSATTTAARRVGVTIFIHLFMSFNLAC